MEILPAGKIRVPRAVSLVGRHAAFFAAIILAAMMLSIVFLGAMGFAVDCLIAAVIFASSAIADIPRLQRERSARRDESGEVQPVTVFALVILAIVIFALIGASRVCPTVRHAGDPGPALRATVYPRERGVFEEVAK